MQLVQPSKFFSVTIFRTRFYGQYWHARVRTCAMLLFLVTLKNFDVCTVTMTLFSEGVYKPLPRVTLAVILSDFDVFKKPVHKSSVLLFTSTFTFILIAIWPGDDSLHSFCSLGQCMLKVRV